ncbi:MAG: hypothetical protein M3Y49_12135, partial [Actinomycetota bacterium]|nr:hypothetical protein [Actinomycetota bacterium]
LNLAEFMNVDTTDGDLDQLLLMAQLRRDTLGPLELCDAQIERAAYRETLFADSTVSPERIAGINTLALAYYRH